MPLMQEVFMPAIVLTIAARQDKTRNPPGYHPHDRCLSIYLRLSEKVPMMIALPRLLILASFAALAVLLFAPIGAQARTCQVVSAPPFGTVTLDIVDKNNAGLIQKTTTGIKYRCTSDVPFTDVRLCAYIKVSDPKQNSSDDHTYYQIKDSDSRLAWQLADPFDRRYAHDGRGRLSTGGIKLHVVGGGTTKEIINNDPEPFPLIYLNRQLQDRVRPGTYIGTYQLVTRYLFNAGNARCEAGLSITNITGTIITPFTLTTIVPPSCVLENPMEINFGNVGASDAMKEPTARGSVDIRCTYETPYNIKIDDGQNSSNGQRRMKSADGKNFIPYLLCKDSSCSTLFSTNVSIFNGRGGPVNTVASVPIHAKLLPLADKPAAGAYQDTVVVTVTY